METGTNKWGGLVHAYGPARDYGEVRSVSPVEVYQGYRLGQPLDTEEEGAILGLEDFIRFQHRYTQSPPLLLKHQRGRTPGVSCKEILFNKLILYRPIGLKSPRESEIQFSHFIRLLNLPGVLRDLIY
jgi:hypothetical protein